MERLSRFYSNRRLNRRGIKLTVLFDNRQTIAFDEDRIKACDVYISIAARVDDEVPAC